MTKEVELKKWGIKREGDKLEVYLDSDTDGVPSVYAGVNGMEGVEELMKQAMSLVSKVLDKDKDK